MISQYTSKPCLDVGFGTKPFKEATHGIEPEEKNVKNTREDFVAVKGSGHDMPFKDNKFNSVVAKRVMHHFSPELREKFINEVKRVLKPEGKFVVLEGTPGTFRKLTKHIGFSLGLLGEDNDRFGHLSVKKIEELIGPRFKIIKNEKLGSPIMPFSVIKSSVSEKLFPIYKKTNLIRWWTFIAAKN